MKKIFLYFILSTKILFAQQIGFEKTYQLLTHEEASRSTIQDADGGFVVAIGPWSNTSYFLRDYGLLKLNSIGDTVWYTTFFMNYYTEIQLVKKAPDKGYVVIGLAEDSLSGMQNTMLFIAKFDSLGYLNWTKFYSNPQFSFNPNGISAEFIDSTKALFIGNGGNNLFLLLDSAYNLLSIKNYGFSFNVGGTFKILALKFNSNFWYYSIYRPILFGPYSIKFLEVASNGDTLKTLPIPNDSLANGRIVKITNSYFIAIGYKPTTTSQNTFFVSKIDSAGNKLWSKQLLGLQGNGAAYSLSCYTTLLNGNNVACFIPSVIAPNMKSFIYCFNDNGDSLWTQYFKDDTTYSTRLLDVVATADSGLLACGQITEPGGALKDYIVKTNSNGLILNTFEELQKKETNYVHLYPNPANSYTNIHYVGANKNVNLSITNLQGQVIYREQLSSSDQRLTLNTTNFPPGFYFCNISAEGKNLLSKKLVVLK